MTLIFNLEYNDGTIQPLLHYKIRYTFSKNNQTSTLTVSFYNMNFLLSNEAIELKKFVKSIFFIKNNDKFSTNNIQLSWVKGKPLFFNAIFLITSEIETLKLKSIFTNITKD